MNLVLASVSLGDFWSEAWRIAGTFGLCALIYGWWYFILKNFGTY